MGIKVNKALLIDVPDEVLVDRVQGRVMCDKCGASYHLKNNPPPWRCVRQVRRPPGGTQ